jgi:hypothetical protein
MMDGEKIDAELLAWVLSLLPGVDIADGQQLTECMAIIDPFRFLGSLQERGQILAKDGKSTFVAKAWNLEARTLKEALTK